MLSIGYILNRRYRLKQLIGSGGSATVYLAYDLILKRDVAVKVLKYDFVNEEKMLRRFQREAKLISTVYHKNIVNLYDVDQEGHYSYLVMEYVDGVDLKQYIKNKVRLSVDEIYVIMKQIISAMAVAHKKGIIHRDLKTQNILISKDNVVKITDFGIATGLNETALTQTNTLIGSIHYLSPELARGSKATIQSDIYALGIIMYELMKGTVPFNGDSAVSIAMKHFQNAVPSIDTIYFPQSIQNVMLKALSKNPDNRFDSCEEMLMALDRSMDMIDRRIKKYIDPSLIDNDQDKPTHVISKPTKKEVIKPKKEKRVFKKWFVITALASAILFILTLTFFWNANKVSVPDISGKSEQEAVKIITDANLIVDKIEKINDKTVAKDLVIKTDPASGTKVDKNSKITIYISLGNDEITLEDYTNQDYTSVYNKLMADGLVVERKMAVSSTIDSGKIISQSLSAGTTVKTKGTIITLTVSSGAISLEDYISQNYDTVKKALESQGFKVSKTDVESNVEIGKITKQSIKAGEKVDPNATTITFEVSKGILMPNLIGSTNTFAQQTLADKKLTNVTIEYAYSSKPKNTVISQSVSGGTYINSTKELTLIISQGELTEETTSKAQ